MPPLNSYNGNGNASDIICSLTQSQLAINQPNESGGTAVKPIFNCVQYSQKVLLNLNALRQNSRFCDVEIVVGSTTIQAHRAVLSAASAYFEAMFRPELGLSEGKQKSVTLHSIRADILKLLIDFVYTGQVEIKQTPSSPLVAYFAIPLTWLVTTLETRSHGTNFPEDLDIDV